MLSDYRTSSTWPTGSALISLFALCPPFSTPEAFPHEAQEARSYPVCGYWGRAGLGMSSGQRKNRRQWTGGHRGPATLGTHGVGAKDDLWFAQWGGERKIDYTPNERLPMSLIYGASFYAGEREAEACGG